VAGRGAEQRRDAGEHLLVRVQRREVHGLGWREGLDGPVLKYLRVVQVQSRIVCGQVFGFFGEFCPVVCVLFLLQQFRQVRAG